MHVEPGKNFFGSTNKEYVLKNFSKSQASATEAHDKDLIKHRKNETQKHRQQASPDICCTCLNILMVFMLQNNEEN